MNHTTINRRQFLRGFTSASAALGLGTTFSINAFEQSEMFGFRDGSAILPLNFNENSLGMSEKARQAAREALVTQANRYQVNTVGALKEALQTKLGIKDTNLLVGHGSTDLIRATINLAKKNNATIVEPDHTFGDVRRYSAARGLNVIKVPMKGQLETDIAALKSVSDSITGNVVVNICNPNNPTGSVVDKKALKDWIVNAPDNIFFIADEAYYEYAADYEGFWSPLDLIKQGRENVIVTRTFSKIYGMAGMRVGYGIAGEQTIKALTPFAGEFYLNAAGVAAGIASINDDEFYKFSLASNNEGKKILTDALDEMNLPYIESHTNFILHKITTPLDTYNRRMAANNVLVGRRMTTEDAWNRLSIGTPEQMVDFVKVLKGFREKGWV